jgi:polo-like kinase 4
VLAQISRSDNVGEERVSGYKIQQSLSHPSIVSLFSVFKNSATWVMVTEFCPQGSLANLIDSRMDDPLTEAEIRHIVHGVAEGLVYLDSNDIVHRNVNPSSILLTADLCPVCVIWYNIGMFPHKILETLRV